MHPLQAAAAASLAVALCLHSPLLPLVVLAVALLVLRVLVLRGKPPPGVFRLAFFHPFTNDGGGGERVLWCMIRSLQEQLEASPGSQRLEWVVYTGDEATPASLAARARELFGVSLKQELKVVPLHMRSLVEASSWPHMTLLGQSLGSMALAAEALVLCPPSAFVDTAGYSFAYPVAKLLASCAVVAYTHYPTISTDMLQRVRDRSSLYNNSTTVTGSSSLSALKLLYYRAFATLYGLAGSCVDVAMVNSSWTEAHIRSLWRWTDPSSICRVYPPCDTSALQKYPLERPQGERFIVSVAQFRPEKNHSLQLHAFAQAVKEEEEEASAAAAAANSEAERQEQGQEEQAETGQGQASGKQESSTGLGQEVADAVAGAEGGTSWGASGSHGPGSTPAPRPGLGSDTQPGTVTREAGLEELKPSNSSSRGGWGLAGAALGLLGFGRTKSRRDSSGQRGEGNGEETDTDAAAAAADADAGAEKEKERRPLEGVRLKLVGGARDKQDQERVELLASLAEQLGISGRVDFCVNVPFSELQGLLGSATCGIHTMLDEHFGISIVEYMAAGAIAIAHNSGGPKADILQAMEQDDGSVLSVGFLASSVDEYASAIRAVFSMLPEERMAMATRARERSASYSEAKFAQSVWNCFKPLFARQKILAC